MRGRTALALVASAVTVGGCGSASRPGQRIPGRTLTVYFSGPFRGASSLGALAALNGAKLALAEAKRLGRFRVVLRALDDSTPQSDGWDPSQTTRGARAAAQDPTTVAYIGDFNSGASAISIPLLGRVGIAQVSPGSTAVGLTTNGPGAAPGEPAKYYPTGTRTFARVPPTDAVQARALLAVEQARGCQSTFVLEDGEFDAEDAALTYLLTAQSAGRRVVAVQAFQRQASDYTSLARSVASSGADCVLISSIDEPSAARLTQQVAQALPAATIFATSSLADSAYTNPAYGGIPLTLDHRVVVLSATLGVQAYPASARAALARYTQEFGPPELPALYGYEAMEVVLGSIRRATDNGRRPADRARILAALMPSRVRRSPIGAFRIDAAGDTSIDRFGVYRIVGGRLVFAGTAG